MESMMHVLARLCTCIHVMGLNALTQCTHTVPHKIQFGGVWYFVMESIPRRVARSVPRTSCSFSGGGLVAREY